jgi:hypothetical protein
MPPITPLALEAKALIEQLDQVLGTVRLLWLDCAPHTKERNHWMARLNQLLDQRSHLMALRDSCHRKS